MTSGVLLAYPTLHLKAIGKPMLLTFIIWVVVLVVRTLVNCNKGMAKRAYVEGVWEGTFVTASIWLSHQILSHIKFQ